MRTRSPVTLALDLGGTVVKLLLLDARGRPRSAQLRLKTPRPATPRAVLRTISSGLRELPPFDRVSVGFPGVVVDGVAHSAANLHPAWIGQDVARRVRGIAGRPTKVANDADVQGMAVIEGRGLELVVTLGTGVGSALFVDGKLAPNLELGHHPFRRGETYEEQLGDRALKRIGRAAWHARLRMAIATLQRTFSCRRLYLGGGNARLIRGRLPRFVKVVDNVAGLLGGIRLWTPSTGHAKAGAHVQRAARVSVGAPRSPRSADSPARSRTRRGK